MTVLLCREKKEERRGDEGFAPIKGKKEEEC